MSDNGSDNGSDDIFMGIHDENHYPSPRSMSDRRIQSQQPEEPENPKNPDDPDAPSAPAPSDENSDPSNGERSQESEDAAELSDSSNEGGLHPAANASNASNTTLQRLINQYRHRKHHYKRVFKQIIKQTQQENKRLAGKVEKLQLELAAARGDRRKTVRTWPEALQDLMDTQDVKAKKDAYKSVWKLCNKEECMSTRENYVHPDINFVPAKEGEDEDGGTSMEDGNGDESRDEAADGTTDGTTDGARDSPTTGTRLTLHGLSPELVEKILKYTLCNLDLSGNLIHCISRLDPYVPPTTAITSLKGRFHWGDRDVNITNGAKDPNEVLAVLSTCRRLYWVGAHIFYGSNTFAFSSIGEFGRFCKGIGRARLARVQHIELFWVGSQYLTFPVTIRKGKVPEGNVHLAKPYVEPAGKYESRRTSHLAWLMEMPRLRSMAVHISESEPDYRRRGHEPFDCVRRKLVHYWTGGHANWVGNRSLRTLQGLDFLHALRGLVKIDFFDASPFITRSPVRAHLVPNQMTSNPNRINMRDETFVADVRNSVLQPKHPEQYHAAALENLIPLLPLNAAPPLTGDDEDIDFNAAAAAFNPSDEDWRFVKSFYQDGTRPVNWARTEDESNSGDGDGNDGGDDGGDRGGGADADGDDEDKGQGGEGGGTGRSNAMNPPPPPAFNLDLPNQDIFHPIHQDHGAAPLGHLPIVFPGGQGSGVLGAGLPPPPASDTSGRTRSESMFVTPAPGAEPTPGVASAPRHPSTSPTVVPPVDPKQQQQHLAYVIDDNSDC